MQSVWEVIKNYYSTLGTRCQVDPIIFLARHVVATPLFILCIKWLVKNYRNKKSLACPLISSVMTFNAANIYVIIFGKIIPWWIYVILGATTLISGYFSYKSVNQKLHT
ncbi:MAG: hypothetical protein ABIR81_08150 [Ginsengibacter sp.]